MRPSDLLDIADQLHLNAETRSAVPLAELQEPPYERVSAMSARIRVVGSDQVYEATAEVSRFSRQLGRQLFAAQHLTQIAHASGTAADTVATIAARDALGKTAEEMGAAIEELERRIRAEMRIRPTWWRRRRAGT